MYWLCAQTEEANIGGVDIVAVDQFHDRIGRHRVDTLLRAGQPKGSADYITNFVPVLATPIAPVLQVDSKWRHVNRDTANTDGGLTHGVGTLFANGNSDDIGRQRRLMGHVVAIAQQQLQGVFTRGEFHSGFSLALAEMHVIGIGRHGQIQ